MPIGSSAQRPGADDAGAEPIRVLVVDDDADLLDVTKRQLGRALPASVIATHRRAEAGLTHLRENAVDCVVADYRMPEMDGLDLLDAVRQEYPELPFLLFTGRGSEEVASEAISAGVDDYVKKTGGPEQFKLLATRIQTLVKQRRTSRQLARNEERISKLLEYSPTVTRTMTADGTLTYVSPSAEEVLGYPPDELLGQDGFEYIHPADRDRVRSAVDRLARNPDEVHTVEYRYHHGDGTWHWVRSRGRNLLDDPAVRAFVINTEDVSERAEYERELERQNERLEEFASVVSHDLRNPLNVVLGTAELATDDPSVEHIERIEAAATRMNALIEDLLTLARQGQIVGETGAVDIAVLASRVWERVETGDATLTLDDEFPHIEADSDRLAQLFQNLFGNAIQHGGPAVSVTVQAIEGGFAVEDDGPGIPADEQPRVFDRGYTTGEEGTGFGLAIVRTVVDAHGWTIDLVEGHDGGARFEITGIDGVEE